MENHKVSMNYTNFNNLNNNTFNCDSIFNYNDFTKEEDYYVNNSAHLNNDLNKYFDLNQTEEIIEDNLNLSVIPQDNDCNIFYFSES